MANHEGPERGTVRPTHIRSLLALFLFGGVLGYALVRISIAINGVAPQVQWTSVIVLLAAAAIVLVLANSTYRTLHRDRRRMDAHRAVRFLLLAKASAMVGAIVAGSYLGFALHFVNQLDVALPQTRVIRSVCAAISAVLLVVGGLLLERACRFRRTRTTRIPAMAGRRRTQRSVRVTVAAALVGVSALIVVTSLVSATLVGAAAVFSVLAGACAARITYSEVVQSRYAAAVQAAAQARSFRDSMAASHVEHLAFTETMRQRIEQRDNRIAGLTTAVRLTERRAEQAETRVKREAQRANDAQERLAALLDEVLGTAGHDVDEDRQGELTELPAIVDLMRWDSKATA